MRQDLRLRITDSVAGIKTIQILIVIAFRLQDSSHAVVRLHPIVHAIAHDIGIEIIAVADGHPDAERLDRTFRNELIVEPPCAIGILRIEGPLLIHESAGEG